MYWRCIHGTSEEFECASGTAWDHLENRCNWLDSVDCSRAEKTTEKIPTEGDDEEGKSGEAEEPEETTDNNEAEDDNKTKKNSKKTTGKKRILNNDRKNLS
jgi:hypothetical protein